MTALNEINPEALYMPGLRFWKQAAPTRHGLIAQNANGAIEIWHALKDPAVGQVLAHSPNQRDGYDLTMDCSILGGRCFSRDSFPGYTLDFWPLIRDDAPDGDILKRLAEWHDATFARQAVVA